jgi:hypothetical protein
MSMLTLTSKTRFRTMRGCQEVRPRGPKHYIVLNFYQINRDDEIQTCDHLVTKALIPYKKPS